MNQTQQDTLASWLKDAHAMKAARVENLERQVSRFDSYPDVQQRLKDHVVHSRDQISELEGCLNRLGEDTSTLKEASSKIASKLQGWTTSSAPDEAVKNAIADEAFAEFEAASFDSLAVAAEQCGETEIAEACAKMRDEERRVAEWLRAEVPAITRAYLNQGARA